MKKAFALFLSFAAAAALAASESVKNSEDWHECTSWVVMPDLTAGKRMLLHKNRDSTTKSICLYQVAEPGKFPWIAVSNNWRPSANMGLNSKGLAVVMNSGDPSDAISNPKGLDTTEMAASALANCATAEAAVKHLHELVKARNYSHGASGSIWYVADSRRAFVIEHDALRFAFHEVPSGFSIRANSWHFPEMVIYSKRTPTQQVKHNRRESAVRKYLFEDGTKYKEVITPRKIHGASRIDVFPEDPKCYPLCGNSTNSAATISVDCEYPEMLSSIYAAFGPPRYTVYLPIPFVVDKLPEELFKTEFSDAIFARRDARRDLLPMEKLVEFERRMIQRHEEAVEKARAALKKGGSREDVQKILSEAFHLNWDAVKTLCKGK